jgi:hypothetical protein
MSLEGRKNLMRGAVALSRTSPAGEWPMSTRVSKEARCWSTGKCGDKAHYLFSEVQPKSMVATEQLLVARSDRRVLDVL